MIFRPSIDTEFHIRELAQNHLITSFPAGNYSDPQEIDRILKHQFHFYQILLEESLPKVSCLQFLLFLLQQYEFSSEIDQQYKKGQLDINTANLWKGLGPNFRRALKFLIERTLLCSVDEEPPDPTTNTNLYVEKLFIAAEEMTRMYILSDQTFYIFPDETSVTISSNDSVDLDYIKLEVDRDISISNEFYFDTRYRSRYLGKIEDTILGNLSIQDGFLREAIAAKTGISFDSLIRLIGTIIELFEPLPYMTGIYCLSIPKLINNIREMTDSAYPSESIYTAIKGFAISRKKMEEEGREIWKIKQEYRMFRRGFVLFSQDREECIAFSKNMAKESLLHLHREVPFKKLPPEWQSDEVQASLIKVSEEGSSWFESIVAQNLSTVGVIGRKNLRRSIGSSGTQIQIPQDVGELDFLGYSVKEKRLILLECKMVGQASESQLFKRNMHDFISREKKSYIEKFRKKIDWVHGNIDGICCALNSFSLSPEPISPQFFSYAMITLYPNIVSVFFDEFPCASLTNFMLKYLDKSGWPYDIGTVSL